jgi:xanthine dehydrogenase YagR molybdenum-binding subunit
MIGEGIDRVDGRAKAQGAVVYSGDLALEGMVHAALVQSPISNGRIFALDTARATSVAGMLAVLHHGNTPRLAPRGAGEMPLLLQDDRINYGGQPIAAVAAADARPVAGAHRHRGPRCRARTTCTDRPLPSRRPNRR